MYKIMGLKKTSKIKFISNKNRGFVIGPLRCKTTLSENTQTKQETYDEEYYLNKITGATKKEYNDFISSQKNKEKDTEKKEKVKWVEDYISYQKKWRANPFEAKFKVQDKLDCFDMFNKLELDWTELSGAREKVITKAGFKHLWKKAHTPIFGLEPEEHFGLEEEEKRAKEKFETARKSAKLVALSPEEQLKYAQMVRHLEDDREMQWGESVPDIKRWDAKWPRYIMPDGTPKSNLENMPSVKRERKRIEDYENERVRKLTKNKIVGKALSPISNEFTNLLTTIKLLLLKLGVTNEKITDFIPKLTPENSLIGREEDYTFLNFLDETNEFLIIAKHAINNLERSENLFPGPVDDNFKGKEEAIKKNLCLELSEAISEAKEILNEVERDEKVKMVENDNVNKADKAGKESLTLSKKTDPRLEEDVNLNSANRTWSLVVQRQQELFNAVPENRQILQTKIADMLKGARMESKTGRLVLPKNRVKTGDKAVDEHFERLVEAIENAKYLSAEKCMEFFSKIPSNIGGPGEQLARLAQSRK